MSEYLDKPFCACSTPGGTSGIAVIRLNGEGASDGTRAHQGSDPGKLSEYHLPG